MCVEPHVCGCSSAPVRYFRDSRLQRARPASCHACLGVGNARASIQHRSALLERDRSSSWQGPLRKQFRAVIDDGWPRAGVRPWKYCARR